MGHDCYREARRASTRPAGPPAKLASRHVERSPGASGASASTPTRRDIVVLKGVRKAFGDTEVLRGIDLVCRHGETTCIVGGSGAGKTTLLRLVVALEKPTSGSIYVDGDDIVPMGDRELNGVRKKFGMVYQYAALLDSINVLDNVAFPLVEHTKLSRAEIRQRVVEKLRILELERASSRSSRLSSRAECANAWVWPAP